MAKSFASKSAAVFSLLLMTTLSCVVSAESFSSYKKVPGVVKAVDAAESTITITTEEGVTKTYSVIKGAKVATEKGRVMSLSSLQKGDTVILKNRVSNTVASEVKSKTLTAN